LLSVGIDGYITFWHSSTGKVLYQILEQENPLMCLDYNREGNLFAVSGNDKKVNIYDDDMKTLLFSMKSGGSSIPLHSNRIFSLNFNKKNENLLASGGWDSRVIFYDVKEGKTIGSILGPHICGDAIDFKDNMLLTGSATTTDQIQLWDIRTYKLIETVKWDENNSLNYFPYSAQFSKFHNIFGVGASSDNNYRVFDNDNKNKPISGSKILSSACYSIDFSSNGSLMAYGCGDGNVRLVSIIKKN